MKLPAILGITLLAGSLGFFLLWKNGKPSDVGSAPTSRIENVPLSRDKFTELTRALVGSPSPKSAQDGLAALRSWLLSIPKEEATELIEDYLAGGQDAILPLEFNIGADGFLTSSPTLRTALLDLLGALHPAEAARISRKILAEPTHPDEWALALRNVAKGEDTAETKSYLVSKTLELINAPEWQAEPSIGFLNAFDVLVFCRATETTPLLSTFIQNKERRDLVKASFLTLDRLNQAEPAEILNQLLEDSTLQQTHPGMVAQQFARADLGDKSQRAIVRSWLLDGKRTGEELTMFANSYPNQNQMISQNLLTDSSAPPRQIDIRESLQVLSDWSHDPDFAGVQSSLDGLWERLIHFGASTHPRNP